jgi:hypothetical protein
MSEIIKAADFGLEEKQVESITLAFLPNIEERKLLTDQYRVMLSQEMSRDTAKEAGTLRRKLVRVRTGLAKIHKTQKAFFLASGRFVDAHKNMETEPVIQMEEKLKYMEDYYVNLEKERIDQLHTKRYADIKKYIDIENIRNFGEMGDDDYTEYFRIAKKRFDDLARIQKEEKEAAEKILEDRRIEREKLQAQAKKDKEEIDRLKEERDEREAQQKAVQAKRDKEDREREDRYANKEAEELAENNGDDESSMAGLIMHLGGLKTKYTFQDEKAIKKYKNVGKLLDKVINYIKED